MRLYFVELTFFDNLKEKEAEDKAFVFASSMSDAVSKVEDSFNEVMLISISEINSDCTPGVIYLPFECDNIEDIKNANCY